MVILTLEKKGIGNYFNAKWLLNSVENNDCLKMVLIIW